MDGAFFGLGLGFASFSTVIPLFVSSLTDSAVLIGLVMAVHNLGWQLPQLFMARHIHGKPLLKPMVVFLTIQERVPFLGLVLVALFASKMPVSFSLAMIFLMLIWQGFGGGFTANPWQVLITKVIPPDYLATFFGMQGAASNLLASGGAILSGLILDRIAYPHNFALTFAICCVFMVLSWFFIKATREPRAEIPDHDIPVQSTWNTMMHILRTDTNFNWLLVARVICQFGFMGFSFYSVYVVRNLGATQTDAGVMTSILMITQMAMGVGLGWLADRWSRKYAFEIGIIAMVASGLLAWLAPTFVWYYPVMILTGIANTAMWTIMMALTLQFGDDVTRPTYIGMANTLIVPFTISAPLIGGWIAGAASYPITFLVSACAAVVALIILHFMVKDPRSSKPSNPIAETNFPQQ